MMMIMTDRDPGAPDSRLLAELAVVARDGVSSPVLHNQLFLAMAAERLGLVDQASGDTRSAVHLLLDEATLHLDELDRRRATRLLLGLSSEASALPEDERLHLAALAVHAPASAALSRVRQSLLDGLVGEIIKMRDEAMTLAAVPVAPRHVPSEEAPPALSLAVGERLGVGDVYAITQPDGSPAATGETAKPVGNGGSGTVYRALFNGRQPRAIKFLPMSYGDDRSGVRRQDFEATFAQESEVLYQISHGNIAKLHDVGVLKKNGDAWPYLVTEFVAGPDLLSAVMDPRTDGAQILSFVGDVIEAMRFLHVNRVFHGDVKHENIKLRRLGTAGEQVVLLDLGTAHSLRGPDDDVEIQLAIDDPSRRFISTKRITHNKHQPWLRQKLSNAQLLEILPAHDLHSLGVLIHETCTEHAEERLEKSIGRSGLQVLNRIRDNLLRAPDGSGYSDIRAVARDWGKLQPTYLAPAGTAELSLAAEFKYAMPTAVGRGVITPRLGAVLNHDVMQRLRKVPQLELTYLKYPGATHSRFSHSTAVLRNARYYLSHLLNDTRFRLLAEASDLEATLLLALLHDIGHYQLSHMFEDFAADQRAARDSSSWSNIDFDIPTDDDLFLALLDPLDSPSANPRLRGGYGDRVLNATRTKSASLRLDYWGPERPTLAEVIRDEFGAATYNALIAIHRLIYASPAPKNPNPAHLILGAVISSDIDSDKTAYLVEDATRTGVPYGMGVDLDGILGALRAPSDHDLKDANRPVIGIVSQGVTSAQSISVNRNQMVNQVYWHHTNRAATAMIKWVTSRLLKAGALSVPDYIEQTLFVEYEEALLWLMHQYNERFPGTELNPIAGLVRGERRPYRRVFSSDSLSRDDADALTDRLVMKHFDELIAFEDRLVEALRVLPGFRHAQSGDVCVDVPLKERERPSGERGGRVLVYDGRDSETAGRTLSSETPILAALKAQHVQLNRVSRIFASPRITPDRDSLATVSRVAREFIRDEFDV
jgi:HD superfamily phosphohydrolase